MLKSRGYWILLAATSMTAGSIVLGQFGVALLGISVLLWISVEWVLFALRIAGVERTVRLERKLNGQPVRQGMLWAGIPAHVEVMVFTDRGLGFLDVAITDHQPSLCLRDPSVTGVSRQAPFETRGPWSRRQPLVLRYDVLPQAAGLLRFEGVRLEIVDRMGCFVRRRFLRGPVVVRVLPPLSIAGRPEPVNKRLNLLPARGIHRHRGPGTSSELLDLRDYLPGDPPKTIAWKISARRDRLMTKQFESEVPVRCTLLLDASHSMRLGWRDTRLNQGVRLVAALSKSLLGNNDPVALTIFSQEGSSLLPHALGRRQLMRVLARLAEAASTPLEPFPCPPALLIEAAWPFCEEVYPDLLDPSINRSATLGEHARGFAKRPLFWAFAVAAVLGSMISLLGLWNLGMALLAAGVASVILAALVSIFSWFIPARPETLISRAQVRYRPTQRKRLASLVATLHSLAPSAVARMTIDDDYFSRELQTFLIEHQVPFRRALFDAAGRYQFASSGKLQVLARHLLRSVAHGRDNELFVLIVDLLELRSEWEGLIRAIKVAVSRHHQVVLICPWPEGLPAPEAGTDPPSPLLFEKSITSDLEALDRLRHRSAYVELRLQLRKLGVPLIAATADEAIAETMRRVEQIRSAKTQPGRVTP